MPFLDLARDIADDFEESSQAAAERFLRPGGGFSLLRWGERLAPMPTHCVHCNAPIVQKLTGRPRFVCPALRCQRAQRAFIERRRVQRLRERT